MKKLIKSVLALALTAMSTSAFAQEDVTSKYLVNPSFEFSAEGVASTAKDLNGSSEYYGWTLPTLGASYSNKSIGNSTACNGNGFGITSASDGDFYFYNRQGWGTTGTSLSQTANLPAGKYYITVDYKAFEKGGTNSTMGFAINGQSVFSTKPFYSTGNSTSGSWAVSNPWKTVGAWFTVDTEGDVKIEITESLYGNSARADLYLDNVKLYKWDLSDEKNMLAASPSTPLDVTAKYVRNPYFDTNIEGWSTWYENTKPQNQKIASNKDQAISGNFFENWHTSTYNGSIYQIARDVPAGKYQLQIAAFGSSTASSGFYVYLNDSKANITSTDPKFYTVDCVLSSDGDLDFGIRNEKVATWMGIDNISLSLLEIKPLSLGNPALSMDATVDVDPEKAAKVTVTFPDTKALTADAESAKYDITIEYEVYKGKELITSGSATAAKGTPIEITIPSSDLESKSQYTVKVVSAQETFCKDYEAATYKDAKIEFTTTATEFEKAQLAFEERINDAEEILENAVIGVNPFQYLPAKAKKFAEEIVKAKEQLEKITDVIDLFDAIALFDMKVAMFHPILPQVNEKFLIKHKASGLYLNLADGVKISASGTPVQFHRTENNTWYIYSTPKREYVGYEGSNAWTMTNTKNHEFSISAESYNIHYILGKNGYIATDATAEGAAVYGDKGKNGNGQWFIEYYETAPLQNLGFDEGNIVSEGICTYGKDMAANGTSLYSAQEVTGWTNASFGAAGDGYENNGFACGAYAWGSTNFLGGKGYTAPATNYEGNTDGAGLGVVATWTTKAQYTQQMELAAGTYTITVPVYNVGGTGEVAKNLIGFVTGDGDEYLATSKKYPVGEWYLEQVTFTLSADTEGVLSVGYEAANAGSGSMPHLFLDYVSVEEGAPSNGSSEEATAVNGISAGAAPEAIYSVDGARLQSLHKGMNIVKMSDGSVKKVLVK